LKNLRNKGEKIGDLIMFSQKKLYWPADGQHKISYHAV